MAFKYAASEAICMSLSGPPCEVANAGMSVPALPAVIQVRQNSSLVGSLRLCRSGTMLARGVASWQTEQTLAKSCWPYLPSTFLAWQLMQSPLNTACRSSLAAARPRARSSSLMGGGGGGAMLIFSMRSFLPLSVLTLTDLNTTPLLPARFTATLMTPFEPPGMVHGTGGSSAVVQPQEGCTDRMVTGASVLELVTATTLVVLTALATWLNLLPEIRAQKPALVTVVKLVAQVTLVASPMSIFCATLVNVKTNRAGRVFSRLLRFLLGLRKTVSR